MKKLFIALGLVGAFALAPVVTKTSNESNVTVADLEAIGSANAEEENTNPYNKYVNYNLKVTGYYRSGSVYRTNHGFAGWTTATSNCTIGGNKRC